MPCEALLLQALSMNMFLLRLISVAAFVVMYALGQAQTPTTVGSPNKAGETSCKAADFKNMAYAINDVQLREKRAINWLSTNGRDCSYSEIETIKNNVAVWLGTAGTEKVYQLVKELYTSKKPASTLEVSKNTPAAPVIEASGSVVATKKIKRLPTKVDEKTAATKEYSLRESEIAQCLPNELVTWKDGPSDTKMISPIMVYVYDHQGAPASVTEESVLSVLHNSTQAWDQCGGQNTVYLKREVNDTIAGLKIAVQWNDDDKLGTIGLANITKKTLTLSPESFQNLKKSNPNRNLMETLQMVVSHEVGHFQGLLAHSKRCVDVLSYYTNDAGEKCTIRDNGVMPKNFEYRSLLPTACDIQRCVAANSK